jgi:mannan endo-1,4-beta-mannosidase
MKPSDVVPYLQAISGKAWLSGQQVPEDARTPTPAQLLNLPAQPAIVGADILCGDTDYYGWDASVQALLTKHAQAGGLIVLCFHPPNLFSGPQDISNAWVANQDGPKPDLRQLTSATGTSTAKARYLRAVARAVAYIKTLPADAPIIFRPWHEMNGSWFWWGVDKTNPSRSEAGIRALWADTIARVQSACPNVISGWATGLSWYADELYGYPTSVVPQVVGTSLYSDTADLAHAGDYAKMVSTKRPLLLFEAGPLTDAPGWPAGSLLAGLSRMPLFTGWVSWHGNYSLLEMSGSAQVLADPRVVNRDRLPGIVPQPTGYVYAASDPGVRLYAAPSAAASVRLPVWPGDAA